MRQRTIILLAVAVMTVTSTGFAAAITATPSDQASSATLESVQTDDETGPSVTFKDVRAERVVLHDVEVNNVTIPLAGVENRSEEALRLAATKATDGNVEGFAVGGVDIKGVSNTNVSVDLDNGTATVSGTIDRIVFREVQADVVRVNDTAGEAPSRQIGQMFQGEDVTVGGVTIEGFQIDTINIENVGETETTNVTETENVTTNVTETENVTTNVTETENVTTNVTETENVTQTETETTAET